MPRVRSGRSSPSRSGDCSRTSRVSRVILPVPTGRGRPTKASAEKNLARAAEIGARIAPHHQYKYSNLGYQLLGEIVARVSGMATVEYITREIIDPLGMRGTGFDPLPEALAHRIATGYFFQPLISTSDRHPRGRPTSTDNLGGRRALVLRRRSRRMDNAAVPSGRTNA